MVTVKLAMTVLMVVAAAASAQTAQRQPRSGYVYPAGGQRGTSFEVIVGGQFLQGVTDAHISGTGVEVTVVQHYPPLMNLDKEQRDALRDKLRELFQKRLTGSSETAKPTAATSSRQLETAKPPAPKAKPKAAPDAKVKKEPDEDQKPKLPEHPLWRNIEESSLRELQHIRNELMNLQKRRQVSPQIGEMVLLRVTMKPNAGLGDRELRLQTPAGLTNPMRFQVGHLPEVRELEPNQPESDLPVGMPEDPPLDVPVLINGQVKPGDVDRFRFRARGQQKLVIEVSARSLIPYLADAVPGWFQATLAVRDTKGREIASADDYRFDPDPVLLLDVPEDGTYEVEIRDAIYRGREDFVYRLAISEQPFITQVFPLGGRTGHKTVATVDGWNLLEDQMLLVTPPGRADIRQTSFRRKQVISNDVTYAVDGLPECNETEPNDEIEQAQKVALPRIINGTIAAPEDRDLFTFSGRGGEWVVAEVHARRLCSPLDSLLQVMDASGRVLEWNDDHEDKGSGLLTHHADSYLRFRLPADGTYLVRLSDAQHQGGSAYGYRLRLGSSRPDFALRLTPASVNLRPGSTVPVNVHVFRKDGFEGDIDVALKDGTSGFTLQGGRIPGGCDQIRMTLTAPSEPLDRPVTLTLEARARIGGRTIVRPVVPAEDLMQAFAYRHLAPAQDMMVWTIGGRRPLPRLQVTSKVPLTLSAGHTAEVRIAAPKAAALSSLEFDLSEPPPGVSLQKVAEVPGGLVLVLKLDPQTTGPGRKDNLIIEAFASRPGGPMKKDGPKAGNRSNARVSLGTLPAIPIEVIRP